MQTYPANKAGFLRAFGARAWLPGWAVRLALFVCWCRVGCEEIIEEGHGHAPQPPEKEAPTRVRRPFGDAAQLPRWASGSV